MRCQALLTDGGGTNKLYKHRYCLSLLQYICLVIYILEQWKAIHAAHVVYVYKQSTTIYHRHMAALRSLNFEKKIIINRPNK